MSSNITTHNVAKNLLKCFLENEKMKSELPMICQLTEKLLQLDDEQPVKSSVNFKTLQTTKSATSLHFQTKEELKKNLLVAIQSNDWQLASQICEQIDSKNESAVSNFPRE